MSNITPTIAKDSSPSLDSWYAQWSLGSADTGLPVSMAGASDRSIQVEGTFGGATVTLQGSNDGTNYHTLTDPQGNNLTWTSADRIEAVMPLTRFTRPITTGGSGSAIVATLFLKGMKQ